MFFWVGFLQENTNYSREFWYSKFSLLLISTNQFLLACLIVVRWSFLIFHWISAREEFPQMPSKYLLIPDINLFFLKD